MTYCGWKGAEKDAMFEDAQRELIAEVKAFSKSKGKDHPYIYLPYAYNDQKPLESYPLPNIERIRAMAQKYDPEEVFQTMVPGGFKISKVSVDTDLVISECVSDCVKVEVPASDARDAADAPSKGTDKDSKRDEL